MLLLLLHDLVDTLQLQHQAQIQVHHGRLLCADGCCNAMPCCFCHLWYVCCSLRCDVRHIGNILNAVAVRSPCLSDLQLCCQHPDGVLLQYEQSPSAFQELERLPAGEPIHILPQGQQAMQCCVQFAIRQKLCVGDAGDMSFRRCASTSAALQQCD